MIGVSKDVKFPANVPHVFRLVTLWSRSNLEKPTKGTVITYIHSPTGESTEINTSEIDLTNYRRMRQQTAIVGFQIKETGLYKFEIRLKQEADGEVKSVAFIPLEIRYVEVPELDMN